VVNSHIRTALRAVSVSLCLILANEAFAQYCPPGSTQVGSGYVVECRCPDGSLAGGYTGCPTQPPQPICPAGTEYCGNSNQCCTAGFYCSKYGCTPQGAVDCGTHYCNPGQQCTSSGKCMPAGMIDCGPHSSVYCTPGTKCSSDGKRCLAHDDVDCGSHTCSAGSTCGSRNSCIPAGHSDCGNGTTCGAGLKCSRDTKRCLPQNSTDCGSYTCNAGEKCGSRNSCVRVGSTDCGNGQSCAAGKQCSKGGGCITAGQLDCGRGVSCPTGSRCGSGNQCLAKGEVDCGGGKSCSAGNKCSKGGGCIPISAVDCGHGVSCPAGNHCGSGNQCLAKRDVDCGNGTACGQGEKCGTGGVCVPKSATACGSTYCNPGSVCVNGKECLTKAQVAERAKEEARKKKEEADRQAWQMKTQKSADALAEKMARSPEAAVVSMKDQLLSSLPQQARTQALGSVAEITLKGVLSIGLRSTLTSEQQRETAKEFADLWTTKLTPKNIGPITDFTKGLAIGAAVDYAGQATGDFLAAAIAKHTSNPYAINFGHSLAEVAFVDTYAGSKGSVPGVLAANGVMIAQAATGAIVDNQKAAISIRAYQVQINDAIALAHQQTDPQIRDRMLKTAEKAQEDLKGLQESHPVIMTLSNLPIPQTVESLRSWTPYCADTGLDRWTREGCSP
jgi:hypothetical protein